MASVVRMTNNALTHHLHVPPMFAFLDGFAVYTIVYTISCFVRKPALTRYVMLCFRMGHIKHTSNTQVLVVSENDKCLIVYKLLSYFPARNIIVTDKKSVVYHLKSPGSEAHIQPLTKRLSQSALLWPLRPQRNVFTYRLLPPTGASPRNFYWWGQTPDWRWPWGEGSRRRISIILTFFKTMATMLFNTHFQAGMQKRSSPIFLGWGERNHWRIDDASPLPPLSTPIATD